MIPMIAIEEQLEWLSEGLTWDDFEAIDTGHIQVHQPSLGPPVDFFMRIGKHLKRPIQAVVALGHFVRVRSRKDWEAYAHTMNDLDPKQPDRCLFVDGLINEIPKLTWRPTGRLATEVQSWQHPYYSQQSQYQLNQSTLGQQAQLQQLQGYAGQFGTTSSTYTQPLLGQASIGTAGMTPFYTTTTSGTK